MAQQEQDLGTRIGKLLGIQQPDGRSNGELLRPPGLFVQEMDYRDRRRIQQYIDWLLGDLQHFVNPPESVEELRERVKKGGQRFLVAKDPDLVGGCLIEDPGRDQEDNFLSLVVVDPNKRGGGRGKAMQAQAIDWAYFNRTSRGQWRNKIDVAVVLGVEGSHAEESIVAGKGGDDIGLGFRLLHNNPRHARIPVRETLSGEDLNKVMTEVNNKYKSPAKKDRPKRIVHIKSNQGVREAMELINSGKIGGLERRFQISDLTEVVILVTRPDGKFEVVTKEFRPVRRFDLWLIRTPETKEDAPVWQELRGLPDRESIVETAS